MIVGDLLGLTDLRIEVGWATPELLAREVTGVTSTDLQDPARYLRPGELVLTGLVWWRPDDLVADPAAAARAAGRFATALRSAEVAGLLAGEGTHGAVPAELAAACRTHGIPLLSVPAGTSFRAVTDRVYLRLWGDLQLRSEGTAAVPATVRRELLGLLHSDAEPSAVLARAVADLGLPDCSLLTTAGRTLGSSAAPGRTTGRPALAAPAAPSPRALPVGPQGASPFDGWLLQPHAEPATSAVAVLHGLAELLGPLAVRARSTATAQRQGATRVLDLIRAGATGAGSSNSGVDGELAEALTACGLPTGAASSSALTPVVVRIPGSPAAWSPAALAEALHRTGAPFVVAADASAAGTAVGLTAAPAADVTAALRAALPQLRSALSARQAAPAVVRAGVGPSAAPNAGALRSALVQAEYALASADPSDGLGGSARLDSLATLLRGIPAEVQAAYRDRLLAPLVEHDRANSVSLLDTLDVFLRLDASWSRTARALHIHVNTVHYRVGRIEELTGRSLSRLEDRLDLRAALLCGRTEQSGV
ncbi:helix-turn-helix domain-containing protein [Streptacidiphilus fuscans]|uniref:Helix-turn-helix domain-containing protein n=1 Tax=Streptacidiphilus fuscans TaxID=2789292 RepID=A0A931AYR9_9ACTN|nr:PucR family transcriptional regulator [Streptacidiphilus fuscans]MBF9068005.1 helix-turn-helix domain-containing protein [Streptacidiphilus fuscans]